MVFSYFFGLMTEADNVLQLILTIAVTLICALVANLIHYSGHSVATGKKGVIKKTFGAVSLVSAVVATIFGTCPLPSEKASEHNGRGKKIWISLSGIIFNLAAVVVGFVVYAIMMSSYINGGSIVFVYIAFVMKIFAEMNASCVMINVLPLPYLDGGNVIEAVLPEKAGGVWRKAYKEFTFFIVFFFVLVLCRGGICDAFRTAPFAALSALFGI